MKQRGDIHPPEVEYDMAMTFDEEGEPRQFDDVELRRADTTQQQQPALVVFAIPEEQSPTQRMQSVARRQVASRPALMALGAFVLGIVAMRLLRRGARAV
jgi:hypothetical protein